VSRQIGGVRARRDLIYGPVLSRRYGFVYGVNLFSSQRKNCDPCARHDDFVDPAEMRARLDTVAFESTPSGLVVCRNGEPTRHPDLEGVLSVLAGFRRAVAPAAPIALLTNGSELHRSEVRRALRLADEVSVELDAGRWGEFRRTSLPSTPACAHDRARMIRKLHGAVVQSCFLEGDASNSGDEDVAAWLRAVEFAMPGRVDCYTLARSAACRKLRAVSTAWLARLAARVHGELGIAVRAFDHDGIVAQHGQTRPARSTEGVSKNRSAGADTR
jgi:wyosine [tRNA(Phe)-imidazoG37] synthetase (radical SAM superfamily)